ncbi:alpha-2-macroglobulin family protein [Marivivens aquimaris]|uniref:alpha-2-macroglobulin family protein n=1 Tax=Marivivens aquimaris TaxID=2774876 RepID=UPI0018811818|nr:alpha-2-macroglobulin family protein [Marivivens aquimaris]
MRIMWIAAAVLAATPVLAQDQSFIPERRLEYTLNNDLPGGDIQSIRDTTLQVCESSCLSDTSCEAFTFNQRSAACFLKAGDLEAQYFAGANSAYIRDTTDAAQALGAMRAQDLMPFVSDSLLGQARTLSRDIGKYHVANGFDRDALLGAAQKAAGEGDYVTAARNYGAALSIAEDVDTWLAYAFAARRIQQDARGDDLDIKRRADLAAMNAYLRASSNVDRRRALVSLAQAFEMKDRGRQMIPALRLAMEVSPDRQVEAMLEDAINKYGFRVVDTEVESDSETPRICAIFNEPLVKTGVDYAPFVQLPDQAMTVEVSDDRLCLDGAEHGQRYTFTLREGMPAESGETLARNTELALYVRDRSASVRFMSNAYVLPRLGDVAIPIETVNLNEVDLRLRRMSDRNLRQMMQERTFGQPVYPWNDEYLDDTVLTDVWDGTVEVSGDLNADSLSRIPLSAALGDQPAGVYLLTATVPGTDTEWEPPATQWFILSDIGISTMLGSDGLTVVTRSLADSSALEGAEVQLVSVGNAELGTATADAMGVAKFDAGLTRGTGTSAPALVTVRNDADMAFLSLDGPAFDLSDRGVEGREPAGPLDVFLTTDRGAYRAGETIHATALLRDEDVTALTGVPLTAILRRPDGVEYSRATLTEDHSGGYVYDLPIAGTAPRGAWRLEVKADTDAAPLASARVLVEDFLPERIDFDIDLPEIINLDDIADVPVTASYLFGAPAAGLVVEGEAILSAQTSVAGWAGYKFGRYNERFDTRTGYVYGDATGDDGFTMVELDLPIYERVTRPLSMALNVRLVEGSGRPVERRATATVLSGENLIGIKPLFDGDVAENATASFEVVGVGSDLQETAMEADWTVNRLTNRYQWYSIDGRWDWNLVTTRERVASGRITLGNGAVSVEAPTTWGEYELVVESSEDAEIASSVSYYAGWYVPADSQKTPDVLDVSLDAEDYAVGDTATLRIVPRYAGTALVSVLSNHVIHMETVEVSEGENLIPLSVTDEWGAGAYVTASVIRPMDVAAGHNPARSMGLAYAAIAPGDRELAVSLDLPEQMRPRGPMDITVDVDGLIEGDEAWVTVAAVDVGILNLTNFKAPEPTAYYFGQRRLGIELRDIYGDLIDGLNGSLGNVRSGGDGISPMGMEAPPPTEELVAYFSGPVEVGADGKAHVSFDLPAFNGTVKVMAVAWSDTGVGEASQDVIVRDPVVLTVSAPRFMAPEDTSRILMEITHTDGPAGELGVAVSADGVVIDASAIPSSVNLPEGGNVTLTLPVFAEEVGLHHVTFTLTTPDGETLDKVISLPVEVNDPAIVRQSRMTLAAGDTFLFDRSVFDGLMDGTGEATLSVGALARLDAPGLLLALDQYPYGCTEQITSRAMPLLYMGALANVMGLDTADDLDERIGQAITEVLGNQDSNGAFGLWNPSSGDLWLDAYVTDFLSRARELGYDVPDRAFESAVDNLRNAVNYYPDFDSGATDLAYALYVLARENAAPVGDLRYYADQKAADFGSPLALAQLGAALASYGEQQRADRLFHMAEDRIVARDAGTEPNTWRSDYGTYRRDTAAVLTLASEANSNAVNADAMVSRLVGVGERASTQEAVWTLLAANALTNSFADAGITLNGEVPDGPLVRMLEGDAANPVLVANNGDEGTALTVTTYGVPEQPEPAGGKAYAISRAYYDLDGNAVDLTEPVAAGERLVAVVRVDPLGDQEGRLMVNDPLPAGFEIDNPNLVSGGAIANLNWLESVDAESSQFLADRFLAAVDWRSDDPFTLAYIVRATTPGAYHHPAASVEDMYRPDHRAWSDAGTVTVIE